jgi:hypothetical protein
MERGMTDSHDATFYVQIEPSFGRYTDDAGRRKVYSLRAVNITQKSPSHPRGGAVLIKLTLRIPDAAFQPLRPEAVIVVPEDMIQINPVIDVEVTDAHQEDHSETPPLA